MAVANPKLTSQRDGKHARAPASMVPLFTARANVPSRTIAALSEASISLRTLSRLTQHRQASCSVSSRASCTWSRDDVKASRHPLVYKPYKQCAIRSASLFSTSTTRRLKLEDEAASSSASRSGTEVGAKFSHIETHVTIFELEFHPRTGLLAGIDTCEFEFTLRLEHGFVQLQGLFSILHLLIGFEFS
jgi:hypothetical protein